MSLFLYAVTFAAGYGTARAIDNPEHVRSAAHKARDYATRAAHATAAEARRAQASVKTMRGRAAGKTKSRDNGLFIGVQPAGIVYADKRQEQHGDYARLAFLPYDTLHLEWSHGVRTGKTKVRPGIWEAITNDAAALAKKQGKPFQVSASGQTVILGYKLLGKLSGRARRKGR